MVDLSIGAITVADFVQFVGAIFLLVLATKVCEVVIKICLLYPDFIAWPGWRAAGMCIYQCAGGKVRFAPERRDGSCPGFIRDE